MIPRVADLRCELPNLVLLFYDYVLVMEDEIHCFWQRRFSFVTLLYVVVRYAPLIDQVVRVAEFVPLTSDSMHDL